MNIHVSILGAAAIIAVAIIFSMRWEISAAQGIVYRLDRWTGAVDVCGAYPATAGAHGLEYTVICKGQGKPAPLWDEETQRLIDKYSQ